MAARAQSPSCAERRARDTDAADKRAARGEDRLAALDHDDAGYDPMRRIAADKGDAAQVERGAPGRGGGLRLQHGDLDRHGPRAIHPRAGEQFVACIADDDGDIPAARLDQRTAARTTVSTTSSGRYGRFGNSVGCAYVAMGTPTVRAARATE